MEGTSHTGGSMTGTSHTGGSMEGTSHPGGSLEGMSYTASPPWHGGYVIYSLPPSLDADTTVCLHRIMTPQFG